MKKRNAAAFIAIIILLIAVLTGGVYAGKKFLNRGPRIPQIAEVASAQYSLNSTQDDPDPYEMSNPEDRQTIIQILTWLRSAKPVQGATSHAVFSMGPAELFVHLKDGSIVTIEPAIDSTAKKLPNGSIQINSWREAGAGCISPWEAGRQTGSATTQ